MVYGREDREEGWIVGRPATGNRKYQIQDMWAIHKEINRLHLLGMKSVDIAAHLDISEAMVSYTINSPIAKREMAEMEAARDLDAVDVAKKIRDLAPRAVEVFEDVMSSELDSMRLKAAAGILDRAGFGPVQKFQGAVAVLTADDIREIKERARDIGLMASIEAGV